MATRLYLTAAAAPVDPVEAVFDAAGTQTWELPATRPTAFKLARAGNWPGATAFATVASPTETSATNAQDLCATRYVSDPLVGAQTITGTLSGQRLMMQTGAAANALTQTFIKVVSGDGATLRGVLYGGDSRTTNVDEITGTLRNHQAPAAGITPVALSSVSAQNGDRIVVEAGGRLNNTVTGAHGVSIRHGSTATPGGANDLAVAGTETTDLNGWVQFSQDLIFEIVVEPVVVRPARQHIIWI